MRELRPAEIFLALQFGIEHSPSCQRLNQAFNARQPNKWFHRHDCRCEFFDRLDSIIATLIRQDEQDGVRRNLDDAAEEFLIIKR